MFKNILVPLDGSEKSLEALEVACDLALKFDSRMSILSVFRHHSYIERSLSMVRPSDPENLDDVLSAYAKEVVENGKKIAKDKGVEQVRGFIRSGQVAKQILSFAKSNEIDLIVIGSQGQGDLSGYLLGGVSHKVTGLARCPVLVV